MKIKFTLLSAIAIFTLIFATIGCSAKPQQGTETPTTVPGAAGLPQMGSYKSESACDNPYYPRRAGTKTRTESDGSITTETTSISGDANKAIATVTSASTNGIDVRTYECSSNGIVWTEWKLYQAAKQVMSTVSYSGMFFPPLEQFKAGYKWEYSIVAHKELADGWVESETHRTCAVYGSDSIQYQGQFIDALRVDCVDETQDLRASDSRALESGADVYSFWYVYGIGIVAYRMSN